MLILKSHTDLKTKQKIPSLPLQSKQEFDRHLFVRGFYSEACKDNFLELQWCEGGFLPENEKCKIFVPSSSKSICSVVLTWPFFCTYASNMRNSITDVNSVFTYLNFHQFWAHISEVIFYGFRCYASNCLVLKV